jgi:2-(1,2-epoxy-1,2-dihydrophenyl)acetyl-CoA isomerase
MVTRVVPDSEVDDVALSFAQRLADGPTRALALTRKAAWAAAESTFEAELRLERWLQQEAGFHADFKEGVAAFLEKRPARFG